MKISHQGYSPSSRPLASFQNNNPRRKHGLSIQPQRSRHAPTGPTTKYNRRCQRGAMSATSDSAQRRFPLTGPARVVGPGFVLRAITWVPASSLVRCSVPVLHRSPSPTPPRSRLCTVPRDPHSPSAAPATVGEQLLWSSLLRLPSLINTCYYLLFIWSPSLHELHFGLHNFHGEIFFEEQLHPSGARCLN